MRITSCRATVSTIQKVFINLSPLPEAGRTIKTVTSQETCLFRIDNAFKYCPGCDAQFECKVGSISLCQCTTVPLTDEERAHINEKYDDCLCAGCMKRMKAEYHDQRFQNKLRSILGKLYRKFN